MMLQENELHEELSSDSLEATEITNATFPGVTTPTQTHKTYGKVCINDHWTLFQTVDADNVCFLLKIIF